MFGRVLITEAATGGALLKRCPYRNFAKFTRKKPVPKSPF